jgi:nucleoside phosphorylase
MATGDEWYLIGVAVANILGFDFVASHLGEREEWTLLAQRSNAEIQNRLYALDVPLRTDGLDGDGVNSAITEHFRGHPSDIDLWYHLGRTIELVAAIWRMKSTRGIPPDALLGAIKQTAQQAAAIASTLGEDVHRPVAQFLKILSKDPREDVALQALNDAHRQLRHLALQVADDLHVGIITMKEEEMAAVLDVLPETRSTKKRRYYNTCTVTLPDTRACRVGVVRCVEQGTGEAQAIAQDFLHDLAPHWILVVGIAGGAPRDEFTLGDVVVSTKLYDLTVQSRSSGGKEEFQISGGWMPGDAATLAANLPAMKKQLGNWNVGNRVDPRPVVGFAPESFQGDDAWQRKVRESLEYHHAVERAPKYTSGPVVSSDRLLKDEELLQFWLRCIRDAYAIEMENAGVYRAVRHEQTPLLAIRGISDIVGYKRSREWTEYACKTSASFTRALIDTGALM